MKLLAAVNRAVVFLSAIALLLASAVLTYSVVVRYFWPQPTDWQDEFSVFLLIGVTFMSAAWVQSQRGHIGIEAVAHLLPPRLEWLRLRLVDVCGMAGGGNHHLLRARDFRRHIVGGGEERRVVGPDHDQ